MRPLLASLQIVERHKLGHGWGDILSTFPGCYTLPPRLNGGHLIRQWYYRRGYPPVIRRACWVPRADSLSNNGLWWQERSSVAFLTDTDQRYLRLLLTPVLAFCCVSCPYRHCNAFAEYFHNFSNSRTLISFHPNASARKFRLFSDGFPSFSGWITLSRPNTISLVFYFLIGGTTTCHGLNHFSLPTTSFCFCRRSWSCLFDTPQSRLSTKDIPLSVDSTLSPRFPRLLMPWFSDFHFLLVPCQISNRL